MGAGSAVLWKEVREQYLRGGRPTASLAVMAALVVLVALVAPFVVAGVAPPSHRTASVAVMLSLGMGFVGFISLTLPMSVVVDAIAGERERHTLETLLASPVPDSAIVRGKAGAVLLAVAAQVALFIVCATISATVLLGLAGILLALAVAAGACAIAFLASTYATGLGFLLSLRAATIKQGQQYLAYANMPIIVLFALSGSLGRLLGSPGAVLVAAGIGGLILVGLDALWWTLLFTRFRRDRLLVRRQ